MGIANKSAKLDRIYFSTDEILDIIKAVKDNYLHLVWFKLLYSLGLTVYDLVNLKVKDVDFKNHTIKIHYSKKFRPRAVNLPKTIINELRIECCHKSMEDLLFHGRNGNQVHPRTIQKLLEKVENRTGKSTTISKLRRSLAVHLLEKGWEERSVAEILGHSNTRSIRKLVLGMDRPLEIKRNYPIDDLTNAA